MVHPRIFRMVRTILLAGAVLFLVGGPRAEGQDADVFRGGPARRTLRIYIYGRLFQGKLDDLRIYQRALSADDVQAIFRLEAHQ